MTGLRDQLVSRAFLEDRIELTKLAIGLFERSPSAGQDLLFERFNLVKLQYCSGAALQDVAQGFREACGLAVELGVYIGLPATTYPIAGMLRLFGLDELREEMIPLMRGGERTVRRPHDFIMGFDGVGDDHNYPRPTPSGPAIHVRTWWLIEMARADRGHASEMLVELITKQWATAIRGQSWHGLHHDAKLPYAGYWAYGVAAVARMFNLDDSSLEGHKYYPYDMAHFLD